MGTNKANSITDTELVKFYKRMLKKEKIKPDGSGFNRMMQIKKRILNKKYKKFLESFKKSSNGIAI
jgi:hypothetical protein